MDSTSLTPLAEYLTAKMKERGMKPTDLARASGVTDATISLIISGQIRDPRTRTVCRLGRGLNVNSCEVHQAACQSLDAA